VKVILDLCAGTGAWSEPYVNAGYDVRRIDTAMPYKQDVRLVEYPGHVHGVLAAPPCTVFSYARNRYKPDADELRDALSVVDACLRIVAITSPKWWALENPINKLRTYLGEPAMCYESWRYGGAGIKPTGLWGQFKPPVPPPGVGRIKASTFKTSQQNADPWDAVTPRLFAEAFFDANP
jgi:hypothetical protein